MKKNIKKYSLIFSSILLSSIIITPTLVSCTSKTRYNQNSNITDNTYEYQEKINNPKISEFNLPSDIDEFSSDPNNPIYDNVYDKISIDTINNDVYNMLSKLGENNLRNPNFIANITNYTISTNNNKYSININFEVKNTNNFVNIYEINNDFSLPCNPILFNPNETKIFQINIDSPIYRSFNTQKFSSTQKNWFAYYFKNVKININDDEYKINQFSLNPYSYSLNTYFYYNFNSVGYNDIQVEANKQLNSLTLDNVKNEIINTYNAKLNLFKSISNPFQNILQFQVSDNNKSTILDFSIKNADNLANITNQLIQYVTHSNNDYYSLLFDIFSNKTINEISNNLKNNHFNYQNLKQIESQIASKGILDLIFTDFNLLLKILANLNIINENQYQEILYIFSQLNIKSSTLLDFIINLIKLKNQNNEFIFLNIIKNIIDNNTIINMLNWLIFENNNLNTQNLLLFLDIFANPKNSNDPDADIIRWYDWLNSIKFIISFANDDLQNIIYSTKFIFGNNIYLNIKNIYPLLPNSLQINGIEIPINKLINLLPQWISFNTNNYIEINNNFSTLEYSVIKNNFNQYALSWQAFVNSTIDINLPDTIMTLSNSSSPLIKKIIANLTNDIFYHIYNNSKYFKPYESKINNYIIENYNPYLKREGQIIYKNIDSNINNQIIDTINNSISNSIIKDTEIVISKFPNIKISKTKTIDNYDYANLIDVYFNLQKYENNFHVALNTNMISKYKKISFDLFTPFYVYNNENIYKNIFNINLSKK